MDVNRQRPQSSNVSFIFRGENYRFLVDPILYIKQQGQCGQVGEKTKS